MVFLAGTRGCICIKIGKLHRKHLRPGLVLRHNVSNNICRKFQALLDISHHAASIFPGYQAYINCGSIRGTVTFKTVRHVDLSGYVLRSGDVARSGNQNSS
jgi:GTPase